MNRSPASADNRPEGSQGCLRWPQVRAVVFDFVGTLASPRPSAAETYRAAAAEFGCELPLEIVAARFRAAFARQEAADREVHGLRTSAARERARWQAIVADVFPELADTRALFKRLWQHFADARYWSVFADVSPTLAALERSGLSLAIATNFDDRLLNLVRSLPELAGFAERRLFVSALVGRRKPAPEFFAAVQRDLGVTADAILLVGDDRENDVAGAHAAGWEAAWLRREGPAEHSTQIASLAELVPGNVGPSHR